jgi:hypothetical protein
VVDQVVEMNGLEARRWSFIASRIAVAYSHANAVARSGRWRTNWSHANPQASSMFAGEVCTRCATAACRRVACSSNSRASHDWSTPRADAVITPPLPGRDRRAPA